MPNEFDLRRFLQAAASARGRTLTDAQLDELVRRLLERRLTKHASLERDEVRSITESVTRDPQIFATSDIDGINTTLDNLRK